MKIEELKWRLAQFLGVAGIVEIAVDLINREKEFLEFLSSIQSSSPRMLEALAAGFALESIWRELEKEFVNEEKSLREEVSPEIIKILIDVTDRFFSQQLVIDFAWTDGKVERRIRRIGQETQNKILEAIEEVTRDL